ncbi:MAG: permease-like cell division protein FtsX [Cyanobacteria bacterium RUI128]|nr:permease-like cell division protein FtsX [Cyanobacteria bacterium RUI128]
MNKLLPVLIIIVLFVGVLFTTVGNTKDLFYQKQNMIVTLGNDVKMDKAKKEISAIPQIKIVKITDRNKEWSKMVNKMDLPNMDNPFKNVFVIKVNKKADTDEIFNKIKGIDFVENVRYAFESEL